MDATQFGPTAAGRDLVLLIQQDPRLQRRVSRLYAEYMEGLKHLQSLPQTTSQRRLLTLWYEDARARAHTFTQPVQGFLCNVFRSAFREAMWREKA